MQARLALSAPSARRLLGQDMNGIRDQVLQVSGLEFGYDKPLLAIPHLEICSGESLAVLGPSGCGKTSLLHLIAGLLKPTSGTITILEHEITSLDERSTDRIRGENLGIVFQRLFLIPAISVLDNMLLSQRLSRTGVDEPFAIQLLDKLGIADQANKLPTQLSQGQAQRAAIARALAHRPALLIADEPTSALDNHNALNAVELLSEVSKASGAALMIVTHDERVRDQADRTYDLGAIT